MLHNSCMVSVHLFCLRDVVEAIVDSDDWVEALRHTHPDNKDGAKTRVNLEQSIYSYNNPQAREKRIYSDQSIHSTVKITELF